MSEKKSKLPYAKTLVSNIKYENMITLFLNLCESTGIYKFPDTRKKEGKNAWVDFITMIYGPSGPFYGYYLSTKQVCYFDALILEGNRTTNVTTCSIQARRQGSWKRRRR